MTFSQATYAKILGAVLLLVGIIGFFNSPVLGIFGVNGLHNAVHILSGVLGLAAGITAAGSYASLFNKTFGIVYLLVTLVGFVAVGFAASFLGINTADNFLHLAIGLVTVGVGFGMKQ